MSKIKSERHRKYKQKKIDIIENKFGSCCFLCKDTERMYQLHRKDGKPHKYLSNMNLKELEEIDTDLYVRLCYYCHKSVHWCMDVLKLAWDDIIEIRNRGWCWFDSSRLGFIGRMV